MRPSNLTNIDFSEIRESIKSYMRTRPEFTDYDFDGSTLSYLLDVLAYNTYYSSFNANMALNELFLETATIRDNVASLARMLNYLPRSAKASWGCVTLQVQTTLGTTGNFPGSVTLKKGQVATGNLNGQSFSFSILQDKTVEVDKITGIALIGPFKVYEGDLLTYSYTVDTTIDQKFIIPNDWVDIDTLNVYVKQNIQSTTVDKYSRVTNITTLDSSSRSYFVSEYEDRRYEVTFGDGIIGKALEDGNVIILEYIRTSGPTANNIGKMGYNGTIIDIDGNEISPGDILLELNSKTQLGDKPETLKSIKFNAPRFYSAQNRAVTTKDYENIVKTIYPNAKYVMATGGETLSPPVYGKVFVSVKTKTNTKLNNLTKKQIIDDLRPYSMASIEVVVQDPEEVFVTLNVLVVADLFQSSSTTSSTQTTPESLALPAGTADMIKEKVQYAIQRYGVLEDLGNFNKVLSTSKIQKEILQADKAIVDVLLQVTVYKLLGYPLEEQKGNPMTWDVNYGIALDCSCASSPGDVIKSSGFYTAERPTTLQYLEDDGTGYLRQYYIDNNKKVYTNLTAGLYDCDTGIIRVGPIVPVGEVEYIQLSVKPKNPANIAPGEVTGKLLARTNLISGVATSTPTIVTEYDTITGKSALAQAGLTVGLATVKDKTLGTDGVIAKSEITTSSSDSSLVSGGFITPPGGVTVSGSSIITSSSTVNASASVDPGSGTVTTGGTGISAGIGGTASTGVGVSAGAAGTAAGGSLVAAGSTGGVTSVPAIVSPGSAGSPGTVISLTSPTITVVPPGSGTISTFVPGGIATAPPTTINSTPPVLSYPALTPADSVSGTCFP
jgi:hypothetical protein